MTSQVYAESLRKVLARCKKSHMRWIISLHCLHWRGFFLGLVGLWLFSCLNNSENLGNTASHWLHWCIFGWVLICRSKSPFLINVLSHRWHFKGFLRWEFTCRVKIFFLEKDFPHVGHMKTIPDEGGVSSSFKTRSSWAGKTSSLIAKVSFATEVEVITWLLGIINLVLSHSSKNHQPHSMTVKYWMMTLYREFSIYRIIEGAQVKKN